MKVNIDFETGSPVNLTKTSVYPYAGHADSVILCMAFSIDEGPVQLWHPYEDFEWVYPANDPQPLFDAIAAGAEVHAFNAEFEHVFWNRVLVPRYFPGAPEIEIEQLRCTRARGLAHGLPASLEMVGNALGIQHKKDKRGKKLIQQLCHPRRLKGKPTTYWTPNEKPEDFTDFFDYCVRDVEAEIEVGQRIPDLPDRELAIYHATMRMNQRGVFVEPHEIQTLSDAVTNENDRLADLSLAATNGLLKASQVQKVIDWCKSFGVVLDQLQARDVDSQLAKPDLPPEVREILELRYQISLTAPKKFNKMAEIMDPDCRIRGMFDYHKAGTGRWASTGGLNIQNIKRPVEQDCDQLIAYLLTEDPLEVAAFYERPLMELIGDVVRSGLQASPGKVFIAGDWSQIEDRTGFWLVDDQNELENFAKGIDAYKSFATQLYGVAYDDVTKNQRQIAKSGRLGCLFGQGAKGLVGYAAKMGTVLTEAESKVIVDAYRSAYIEIVQAWYQYDQAAKAAIKKQNTTYQAGKVKFRCTTASGSGPWLIMVLPSGRRLWYYKPDVRQMTTPWGEERATISVLGTDTHTRRWGRTKLLGSTLFQNAVQGTARDICAETFLRAEQEGMHPIMLVHDEIVTEADLKEADAGKLIAMMEQRPTWAPDLPLAAEAWVGKRYRK